MRSFQKHPFIPIISLLLVASFITGCAGLALEPSTVAVSIVTPTEPRPTVTPFLTDTPAAHVHACTHSLAYADGHANEYAHRNTHTHARPTARGR